MTHMIENMVVGLKVGGMTGATMLAAETVLLEHGRVSVVVAVSCTVFICGIVWWLASRFQKVDDRLSNMERQLDSLPCDRNKCEKP
jgi:hypothetical protein